eukprot:scaffold15135_cov32-Tisochrysis_lutea.AAC.1
MSSVMMMSSIPTCETQEHRASTKDKSQKNSRVSPCVCRVPCFKPPVAQHRGNTEARARGRPPAATVKEQRSVSRNTKAKKLGSWIRIVICNPIIFSICVTVIVAIPLYHLGNPTCILHSELAVRASSHDAAAASEWFVS